MLNDNASDDSVLLVTETLTKTSSYPEFLYYEKWRIVTIPLFIVTLTSMLHCRIYRAPRHVMVAVLIDLCAMKKVKESVE